MLPQEASYFSSEEQMTETKYERNREFFWSSLKVMLGKFKHFCGEVASLPCLMFLAIFDGVEVGLCSSTRMPVDIHPEHLGRVKECVMPGWPCGLIKHFLA